MITWHPYEDGDQVWTAENGSFYMEVDGSTGRCEIAEWEPESGEIGSTVWEHVDTAGASVDVLKRHVERNLVAVAERYLADLWRDVG